MTTFHTDETIHVNISTPQEHIWEGEARSVSSEDAQGPFDVLPRHANFMCIVVDTPIRVVTVDGEHKQFEFSRAVLHNSDNELRIFGEV